ncbi:MAG: hypothetical protein ABIZ09_19135 [Rhodoferax sp.]|jgi:hypothetical protein
MNIRTIVALCLCTVGLLACARDTGYRPPPALPPPNIVANMPPASMVSLRVIVQFKEAVPFADPAFVSTLQAQAQLPVQFIASVTSNSHVYALQLPVNQDPSAVLQRLRALPSVARVEIDEKEKAN